MAKLKVANIKIVLMTGDQVKTAMAIAYSTGILWSRTAEQIMEENTRLGLKRGDMRWEDPKSADAIIVTGSEFETSKDWRWWDFVLGMYLFYLFYIRCLFYLLLFTVYILSFLSIHT